MVGGADSAVSVCAPIFRALAPGITAATRADPFTRATSAEYGRLHCGGPGAGPVSYTHLTLPTTPNV